MRASWIQKKDGVFFPFWWLIAFGATEPNPIYPSWHHFVLLSCFEGCFDEAWENTACDCTLMYMRRIKRGQKIQNEESRRIKRGASAMLASKLMYNYAVSLKIFPVLCLAYLVRSM
ncbi:uncharacterized protein BKA55DRAFT_373581 [Fusarium redolens]|uniref:Uncharacterized protein n=1 Tax=Fusarium redolens TaxID=48865 RepID=A0A9P9H433_FUSRE|nr:uncharacterized protein BKA55DRAFT_373581 [Fusarium redolens]KAH7250112.1 hypothetical protein BKA55DRAFT_373581 [Fusarium redolens]